MTLSQHPSTTPPLETYTNSLKNIKPTNQQPKISKWKLRAVLILPFVLELLAVMGISTLFSVINGERSVNEVVVELLDQTSTLVKQEIKHNLQINEEIVQLNRLAVAQGKVNFQDMRSWNSYLFSLRQAFEYKKPLSLTITAANTKGELVSSFRNKQDELRLILAVGESAPFNFVRYQVNAQGEPGKDEGKESNFDARQTDFYKTAIAAKGKPKWVVLNQKFASGLNIGQAISVYDQNGKIQGVTGAYITVQQLGDFLAQLKIGKTGQAIILDRNGTLISTSSGENTTEQIGNEIVSRTAVNSTNPLTKDTAQYILRNFGSMKDITEEQNLSFKSSDGKQMFLRLVPLQDNKGLDWLIAVVIPESDFLAQIQQNTRNTVLLTIAATLLAVLIGIFISNRIAKPVTQLSEASVALAQGNLDQTVKPQGAYEIFVLAESFNYMSEQLRKLFANINQTNHILQGRSEELKQRNHQIEEESEILQQDVAHLLDVVIALEEGNLTAEAEVNDRSTGLIADTLNRLIEQLSRIIAIVLSTATQVSQSSKELEQMATVTATQAQSQANSVKEVEGLIVEFNHLSQNTAEQANFSDQAVQTAKLAVQQGEQEMSSMQNELTTLQQSTQQLIKRSEMLNNYVNLAAQFANDQKRGATLTRVLALNASMIASRAASEQDPEQFASVVKEFEVITKQVNDLATQTNQNLVILQQRTEQIQTVVSGLNYDLTEISKSVNQFGESVEQSNQVFENIKGVTDKVAVIGQEVTINSQEIAFLANATLNAISEIATVATETDIQSRFTRQQAQLMEKISANLVEKLLFFRLREDLLDSTVQYDEKEDETLN